MRTIVAKAVAVLTAAEELLCSAEHVMETDAYFAITQMVRQLNSATSLGWQTSIVSIRREIKSLVATNSIPLVLSGKLV